jgi:flagellar hook-length control protein FliK
VLQDAGSNPDDVYDLQERATDSANSQLPGKSGAFQSTQLGLNSRILPEEILVDQIPREMKADPFGISAAVGKEPQKGEEFTFMNGEILPSKESIPPVQVPQGEKISAPMNSGRDFLNGLQGNSMTTASPGRISFEKEFQDPQEAYSFQGDEESGQSRPVNQKSDGLLHSERVQVNTQNLVQPAVPLKTQSEEVLTGVAEGWLARQKEEGSPTVAKQSLVLETVSDTRNRDKDSKSVSMETSTLFVQGQGGPRVNGGQSPVTMGEMKAPSADQIHHQVREKIEKGDFVGNRNSITLKLHPEELGELKINLRMDDQRLKVEIVTENRSVKEALVQNLDTLKETLSRQNISMDRFDVSADIRHGFNQAHREGSRMMQDNRGSNTQYQTAMAAEEKEQPTLNYGWAGEESLVSLVL